MNEENNITNNTEKNILNIEINVSTPDTINNQGEIEII